MEAKNLHEMDIPIREPAFLRDNWKKILASAVRDGRDELRYVRVINGVANITNGAVLVRQKADLPDGFYTLDENNGLVVADYARWMTYPDVQALCPNFNNMRHTPAEEGHPQAIRNEHIGQLLVFLSKVREHDSRRIETVLIDGFSVYPSKRHTLDMEFRNLPCPLPIKEPLMFNAEKLQLALIEMLRYDAITIAYEDRPDRHTPLFLGKSWDQCALLMPMNY